jgi:hypothetical protein
VERVTRERYLEMWSLAEGTPEADDAWTKKVAFMDQQERATGAYIVSDMTPFISVVDGSVVTSRSSHREHMRKHDLIEVGNERMPPRTEKKQSFGHEIKRHLDEVRAMPKGVYADRVRRMQEESNRG